MNHKAHLLSLLLLIVLPAFSPSARAQLIISEFMASNTFAYLDDDKKSSDWIEIFNASAGDVDLQGYYLTDTANDLKRWQFPATNLVSGGSLVVFASALDRRNPGRTLHTNFSLDEGGEFLALVRPDGATVEFAYTPRYPQQHPDISYGHLRGTGLYHYFSPASPGAENFGGAPAVAAEPVFSLAEGVYTNNVEVTLSTPLQGGAIYYTINGNEPTTASSLYTNKFLITNSMVIRARVFADGYIASPTVTRTYWIAGPDAFDSSSNLPLVIFSTFGRSLNESTRTPVSIRFLARGPSGRAYLTQSSSDHSGRATMKIRGSSSTQFPKKSYALELIDEKGDDKAATLLGLPEDSDWVLYAPYTDKTLMRDVLAYELSNRIGRYAPRTRFVEAYLDISGKLTKSDYVGIYVLVEKLTLNKERINIDELLFSQTSVPEISGGYLLKNDRLDPGDAGFSTPSVSLCYVEPKEREMPLAQKSWIRNYLVSFENVLRGANYRDPVNGYAAFIDVGSFIDHQLLVELAKNIDGYRLSTFMYKPRGEKLVMGPLWDYNLTFGNANYLDGWRTNGWYFSTQSGDAYPWYGLLRRDPEFLQAFCDRWFELRQSTLRTELVLSRVDEIAAELEEAQIRNYQRWRILGQYVWPNWYIGKTYADEVNWMKGWIRGRFAWMDSTFAKMPAYNKQGGAVLPGFSATLQTTGTNAIYYTTDGSDPREFGGTLSSKATLYNQPIEINSAATIIARTRTASSWSAPARASFTLLEIDAAWLAYYFTQAELADPDLSGPNADPDQDGSSNLQEFLALSDPRDAADALRLEAEPAGAKFLLKFKARAGKKYAIQSRDPDSAAWSDLQIINAGDDQNFFTLEEPASTVKFYRLLLLLE